MSRVVGIDPGTLSFDLCGLDNGQLFLDETIASADISRQPQTLIDALNAVRPLDLVIAPSGYGLPWVAVDDFGEEEFFLLALVDEREQGKSSGIGGLRALVAGLKESGLPLVFMPGVIHLPTVPVFRKANKIDMGTADKLCCAVLGVFDQARHFDIDYSETSFVYVELGGAFTAILTIQNGQVIDGLGGSSGAPGYYALGAMDGELAYLLGKFHKSELFSGGVSYMAGQMKLPPTEAVARWQHDDPDMAHAWEAFLEAATKAVAAEMTIAPNPREILLSGRLSRIPAIRQSLTERLSRFAPVRQINSLAKTAKEAAQGAALIADGLKGGRYERLIKTMRLTEASGTVLDYIHVASAEALKQKYLSY